VIPDFPLWKYVGAMKGLIFKCVHWWSTSLSWELT